jgi:uncharacterized damage-inducible protein DinB
MSLPEPWLRGPVDGLHPAAAHVFYTFEQCREELARWTADLADRVWEPVGPLAPLGFQIRHIAGSVDRLTTYLEGAQLSDTQLAALKAESTPGATLAELLTAMDREFARTEATLRALTEPLETTRGVGRKALPTTVGGLIVHLAEHTQRHLGQAILTAKLLRGGPPHA